MDRHMGESTVSLTCQFSFQHILVVCRAVLQYYAHRYTHVSNILQIYLQMLRNGCLTLCHLKIPQDVVSSCDRVFWMNILICHLIMRYTGTTDFWQLHVYCFTLQIFDYERMVTILLKVVKPPQPEEFIQRIGIYLLNSLACQVDGKEKQLVGDLGAISVGYQQFKLYWVHPANALAMGKSKSFRYCI